MSFAVGDFINNLNTRFDLQAAVEEWWRGNKADKAVHMAESRCAPATFSGRCLFPQESAPPAPALTAPSDFDLHAAVEKWMRVNKAGIGSLETIKPSAFISSCRQRLSAASVDAPSNKRKREVASSGTLRDRIVDSIEDAQQEYRDALNATSSIAKPKHLRLKLFYLNHLLQVQDGAFALRPTTLRRLYAEQTGECISGWSINRVLVEVHMELNMGENPTLQGQTWKRCRKERLAMLQALAAAAMPQARNATFSEGEGEFQARLQQEVLHAAHLREDNRQESPLKAPIEDETVAESDDSLLQQVRRLLDITGAPALDDLDCANPNP